MHGRNVFNEEKCESAASDPLLLATDLADFWSAVVFPSDKLTMSWVNW